MAIGIDAGGTRTIGVLVDNDCRELARADAGAGNPATVGADAAWKAIGDVFAKLSTGARVKGVCLGQAGIDRPDDRTHAEAALRSIVGPNINMEARNDAAAALGILGPARPAMVVVAGTGSITYGERADGSPRRVGGLGAMISDPGGATSIGLAALRHVARVLDGTEKRGPLAMAVIERWKLRAPADMLTPFQSGGFESPIVASIAPMVAKAIDQGDAAARTIVDTQAAALADDAKFLAREIRTDRSLPVLLVGKVFAGIPSLRERVRDAVRQTGSTMIQEASECVLGAARIALSLAKG